VWLECEDLTDFPKEFQQYTDFAFCFCGGLYDEVKDTAAIESCQLFNGTCNSNATEETTSPNNVIRARTIGGSVAGAAGGVACVAGGGTAALMAYRTRHADVQVPMDIEVDSAFEIGDDNILYTTEELNAMVDNVAYEM